MRTLNQARSHPVVRGVMQLVVIAVLFSSALIIMHLDDRATDSDRQAKVATAIAVSVCGTVPDQQLLDNGLLADCQRATSHNAAVTTQDVIAAATRAVNATVIAAFIPWLPSPTP